MIPSMRIVTPTVVVDQRSYSRYREMRRTLMNVPSGVEVVALRRQCLALHWDFFYSGKPVRTTLPERVSHPLWGVFTGNAEVEVEEEKTA